MEAKDKAKELVEELWVPVLGYENFYEVSNFGNCRSLSREIEYKSDLRKRNGTWKGKLLKPIQTTGGYLKFQFCINGKSKRLFAHRVVALSFLSNNDNKRCVNHIDSNRKNNRLDNLEWVTDSENQIHAYKYGNRENKFYGICCVKKEINITKLISLKDFILKYNPSREQIYNYALFLNTPLALNQFVVCDENGNVLLDGVNWNKNFYKKAKERVLFEGFECNIAPFCDEPMLELEDKNNNYLLFDIDDKNFQNSDEIFFETIEDLIPYNLTLTQTAIKLL